MEDYPSILELIPDILVCILNSVNPSDVVDLISNTMMISSRMYDNIRSCCQYLRYAECGLNCRSGIMKILSGLDKIRIRSYECLKCVNIRSLSRIRDLELIRYYEDESEMSGIYSSAIHMPNLSRMKINCVDFYGKHIIDTRIFPNITDLILVRSDCINIKDLGCLDYLTTYGTVHKYDISESRVKRVRAYVETYSQIMEPFITSNIRCEIDNLTITGLNLISYLDPSDYEHRYDNNYRISNPDISDRRFTKIVEMVECSGFDINVIICYPNILILDKCSNFVLDMKGYNPDIMCINLTMARMFRIVNISLRWLKIFLRCLNCNPDMYSGNMFEIRSDCDNGDIQILETC